MNRRFVLAFALTALCSIATHSAEPQTSPDILKPAVKVVIERNGEEISFPTAREALAAAQDGDKITLGPGTHRGPLLINKSITLKGEPGAHVDANSDEWKPVWTKAGQYGDYAYTSPIGFQPVTVTINHRVMTDVTEARGGLEVHAKGVGRNGRQPLHGLFTWMEKEKKLLVSFASDLDPDKQIIEAAPKGTTALKVDGADNCVIENLIITGGRNGILLTNTKDSTAKNCLIYSCDIGVCIGKGASESKVLSNDITWNADGMNIDCDPSTGLIGDDVWKANKQTGTYDKWGVLIESAGDNNEVAYNYIYDVWDGIENGNGVSKNEIAKYYEENVFKGIAKLNRGLKVHHNRVDLAMDDALEPGNDLPDNQWYSNVISRARCAVRFKTCSAGPFYFYDNILFDCSDGLRIYKSSPENALVYIYHNQINHPDGIVYHKTNSVAWDDKWIKEHMRLGTPGFHLYNNIFVSEDHFSNRHGEVEPDFKADHNLYTAPKNPTLLIRGIDKDSIFDAAPVFLDPKNNNWELAEGSTGKGAGLDLSKLEAKLPLPEGYAAKGDPDIGVLDIAPEKTPRGPISGLWKIAEKPLFLGERKAEDYSLDPVRWVRLEKGEFRIDNLPQQETLNFQVFRAPLGGEAGFTITVLNDKGEKVAEHKGEKSGEIRKVPISAPIADTAYLRVLVEDKSNPQWRIIGIPQQRIAIKLDTQTIFRKYDGGRLVLDYPVADGTDSFKVKLTQLYSGGACLAQYVAPDGTEHNINADGVVPTKGLAGNYRLLVTFTKRTSIAVEGPSPYVILPSDQESMPLKKRWGKPAF
ncbi:MAG: right-handed parallel beta-helix repeat-containing protein [Planctomycetes bacterium]|nr:right-handed parallel beta-helix repeat-containing protein [Planctomycetota bacterium]